MSDWRSDLALTTRRPGRIGHVSAGVAKGYVPASVVLADATERAVLAWTQPDTWLGCRPIKLLVMFPAKRNVCRRVKAIHSVRGGSVGPPQQGQPLNTVVKCPVGGGLLATRPHAPVGLRASLTVTQPLVQPRVGGGPCSVYERSVRLDRPFGSQPPGMGAAPTETFGWAGAVRNRAGRCPVSTEGDLRLDVAVGAPPLVVADAPCPGLHFAAAAAYGADSIVHVGSPEDSAGIGAAHNGARFPHSTGCLV